jgi:hypothetical protein
MTMPPRFHTLNPELVDECYTEAEKVRFWCQMYDPENPRDVTLLNQIRVVMELAMKRAWEEGKNADPDKQEVDINGYHEDNPYRHCYSKGEQWTGW